MLTICLVFFPLRGDAATRLDLPRKRWFTNTRDYSRFYWPVINLPPGNYQGNASPLRTHLSPLRGILVFCASVPNARLFSQDHRDPLWKHEIRWILKSRAAFSSVENISEFFALPRTIESVKSLLLQLHFCISIDLRRSEKIWNATA